MQWNNILIGLGLFSGMMIAAQGAINGRLASAIGGPVQAATISFIVGATGLILVNLFMGNRFALSQSFSTLPWWAWIGGLVGSIMVTSSALAVPRIGVAAWVSAVIAGQLIAAVLYDQFGAFGQTVRPATPLRLLGVVFLFAGVYLVRRF
ncbi:DMT family transporter [Ponticaulis sp.]|uniref:DMT family transporter n=1 Tax=Ponticaulis sp. TaxID=2020902 RepID=UPI000B639D5C|nr:DMT family transporter [Ponticaulis sp.]MAI90583.1 hypothetical protein [Ponticaulis sp.]OUX99098.1 MAG: hypothetical protein CBB65_09100 [Hyphomonadaceae bacterium TMED5]|tara:strand:- start:119464 stop:119913 length:450 start_codon:yes stop_codon:yes gene_type:complete